MYDIDVGALTPPLVLTATNTVPISTAGALLKISDEAGNVIITDSAPAIDATNPLAVKVTHTWLLGQTDVAGTYGAQAILGGVAYPPSPAPFTIGRGAASRYCTVQQARDAGATGTDTEVGAAIDAAREPIDRYTADCFAPTPMTLVAVVQPDGTCLLPRRVRQITRVQPVGSPQPLATTAYTVLSSRMPGQIDAVVIGGYGVSGDPLIAGAEPWNGGWANLIGRFSTGQLEVTGSFGWDAPPLPVQAAAAKLAAKITTGTLDTGTVGPDTDEEGNTIVVTTSGPPPQPRPARSTGDVEADALLFGLRNDAVRMWGV